MITGQQYYVDIGDHSLHLSIDKCEDIDGRFRAYCHDSSEYVIVSGWLIDSIERREPELLLL